MKTYEKVYKLVKKIPKGKVATYGQIGQTLHLNPRVVGWALNRLAKYRTVNRKQKKKNFKIYNLKSKIQNPSCVPWQRVINSKGGISTNRATNIPLDLQKKLLETEGIKFDSKNKIDLNKYQWKIKR